MTTQEITLKNRLKPIRTKTVHREEEEEDDDDDDVQRRDNEEDHQPLSPMSRLFHEPDCNLYVVSMLGLKARIPHDILKAGLKKFLLKHPRFSSLQVMEGEKGEMKWVRTKVDCEKHVIIPEIKWSGGKVTGTSAADKYVEDYICNLTKTHLDFSKPLWELHLLHLKTSEAETVTVLKIHHSLGDGMSLMSLLLACTRKTSDPTALPTIPPAKPKTPPTGFRRWWGALALVWNTIIDVLMVMATVLFLKDAETPLTGPPNVASTPRRIIHRPISLDDLTMIKRATNATINDVMVAIAEAGFSRYLNRRYGGVNSREKKNSLPTNLSIRATHFMNIRPSPGMHTLDEMMKKESKAQFGNRVGYFLLPLSIALRDNPLDYLERVKAGLRRKKASLEALYIYFMAKITPYLVGIKTGGALCLRIPSRTTIWLSNMVGPQEEISFFGYPIAYIASSCFGQPNAVLLHTVSYMNEMRMILSVDETTIPDPHQLLDDLEESFSLLRKAVMATTKK